MPGSHPGSHQPQMPGDAEPRLASISPARWRIRRPWATYCHLLKVTSNEAVRIYALPGRDDPRRGVDREVHSAVRLTEELVHYLGALDQYWPDLSPVDDLRRPGAGVPCQSGDLLNRNTGSG
jgi:hypothetical protein